MRSIKVSSFLLKIALVFGCIFSFFLLYTQNNTSIISENDTILFKKKVSPLSHSNNLNNIVTIFFNKLPDSNIIMMKDALNNNFCHEFEDDSVYIEMQSLPKFHLIEDNSLSCNKSTSTITSKLIADYTYGNWCGKKHGGFDNECSSICTKDSSQITKECSECCPPINYVDRTCMSHDLCQYQYEKLVEESKKGYVCKQKMLNVGKMFTTRCKCTYIIQEKLTVPKLTSECQSLECIAQGQLIEKSFDNMLYDCACFYKEYHRDVYKDKMYPLDVQLCISPSECKKFRGE